MTFSSERAVYIQRDFFSDAIFVRRLFRSCVYLDVSSRSRRDELFELFSRGKLDRLIISNPYRDRAVQAVYSLARAAAMPLLIVERGALPRSVFLDTTGFLCDSTVYDRHHWDRPLGRSELERLKNYKAELATNEEALEPQSLRRGAEATRRRLTNGRKRLCTVTLQMASDTVTNHFCRPGLDYARFKQILDQAVRSIGGDWAFAVKSHPRDPLASIGGQPTANDVNIADLLDATDALITFNSGTGIAAMMRDKPVGCFGDAFYGGEGLTASLASVDDVAAFLAVPQLSCDSETRSRFLYHLIFKVYSEVRFLGPLPFQRIGRPVAMQGRVVRIYEPDTMKCWELDRRMAGLRDIADRELERLRAWYRAAANRYSAPPG